MSVGAVRPGFATCDPCRGMGFLSKGEFYDRKYVPCEVCKGIGQSDVAPVDVIVVERAPLPKNW